MVSSKISCLIQICNSFKQSIETEEESSNKIHELRFPPTIFLFFFSSKLWENTLKGDWTVNKNTQKYYKVSLTCRLRPATLMYDGEFDTLPNYSQCYIMCVEIVSDSDHIAIIHWGPHCIIFYEIYAICPSPCSHLLPNLSHLLHAPQWLLMC